LASSTKTVLFTDLEDYTAAVSEMARDQLHSLVLEHEKKVAFVLEQHGGQVVKNIGDSFLTIFESATDAIKAGISLIASLQDDPDFNVRIGIATGDVEKIGDDFFGPCVNLASRILSKTPSEEIWFAQSTFLAMNTSEIAWDGVGTFLFKGFFREMPVYRAVSRHLFHPSTDFQAVMEERDVFLYRYGDPVDGITANHLVIVTHAPCDQNAQETLCSLLSFVPIQQIWICGYYLSPKDRYSWIDRGGRWLIVDDTVAENSLAAEQEDDISVSFTIILERDRLHLSLSGLALPRPPIADVIGFRYYFDRKGRWSSQSNAPFFSVQVSTTKVLLHVLGSGVEIDGQSIPVGSHVDLHKKCLITIQNHILQYIHIGNRVLWGFFDGVDECHLFLEEGEKIELGREFATKEFSLRNSRRQTNLIWMATPQAQRLKEQGFTLERGLVGRKQVLLSAKKSGFVVTQVHPHCSSHMISEEKCITLQENKTYEFCGLQKLVLGTNVFSILFQ